MYTLGNFYNDKRWINFLTVLKQERTNDNGEIICEHCGKPIVKKYDCIGHHKTELTNENVNDFEISLNADNVMLIHHKCHNLIHDRFNHNKSVYIVYGAPLSGKRAYVDDIALPSDLIVDIKAIRNAISTTGESTKQNKNVFAIRDLLIDQIKCRYGMWKNAYIIGGYPLASDRERLSTLLGAKLIFIDETKENCLNKCKGEKMKEYIEEWFDTYSPP